MDILNAPDEPAEGEKPEAKEVEIEPEKEEKVLSDAELGDVTFDDEEEPAKPEVKEEEPEPAEAAEDAEVPAGQLRFKDIKAKYPNIFKELPQLAQAIRNDRAYGEVFASPEDAQEAAQRASYFNKIENSLASGSPVELLTDLEAGNAEAYKKVVRNFLPAIKEKSMEMYAEITLPAINDVLRSAVRDAEGSENVNLRNAALHIAKYLYGKPEIPNAEGKKQEPHPEEEKLKNERQAFWQEKANDFSNECYSEGREATLAEIAKGIDDDKSTSPFLKKTLKEAIFNEVDAQLGKDARHLRQINVLWRKAESTGFPKEVRREIINAYLRGAKALIPSVRQKLRAEAGIGVVQPNGQPKQEQPTPKRTNIPASGRSATGQAAKIPSARDVNWSKTSDMDFLNGRYTPKRRQ
jgi:hypothetical protein